MSPKPHSELARIEWLRDQLERLIEEPQSPENLWTNEHLAAVARDALGLIEQLQAAQALATRLIEEAEWGADILADAQRTKEQLQAALDREAGTSDALDEMRSRLEDELERKSFGWAKHWEAEATRLKEQLQAAQRRIVEYDNHAGDLAEEVLTLREQLEACRSALAFFDPADDADAALAFAQQALSNPAKSQDDLPTTADMVGLVPDMTGDRSAVEHVRWLRGDDADSNQEREPK